MSWCQINTKSIGDPHKSKIAIVVPWRFHQSTTSATAQFLSSCEAVHDAFHNNHRVCGVQLPLRHQARPFSSPQQTMRIEQIPHAHTAVQCSTPKAGVWGKGRAPSEKDPGMLHGQDGGKRLVPRRFQATTGTKEATAPT